MPSSQPKTSFDGVLRAPRDVVRRGPGRRKVGRGVSFGMLALALLPAPGARVAMAQRGLPPESGPPPVDTNPMLDRIGVDEHLGDALPLDVPLVDHRGQPTDLGAILQESPDKPVAFTFAYHSCPVLCSMVLQGAVDGLAEVPWTVGEDYTFVNVSIDPEDGPEDAAARRKAMLDRYGRDADGTGWHFLTGEPEAIERLTKAVGFRYFYNASADQYSHPAVVMLLTPDGTLARYLYGIQFAPNDLRVGLLEASRGRSVSTVEQVILYCYQYDPENGEYVLVASQVMKIGGALTALALAGILGVLWRRELVRRADRTSTPATSPEQTTT